MLLNLFLASLPSQVNEFVKARTPKSLTDAAEAADLCFSNKSSNLPVKKEARRDYPNSNRQINSAETSKNDASSDVSLTDCRKTTVRNDYVKSKSEGSGRQSHVKGACWSCGSTEHKQTVLSLRKDHKSPLLILLFRLHWSIIQRERCRVVNGSDRLFSDARSSI